MQGLTTGFATGDPSAIQARRAIQTPLQIFGANLFAWYPPDSIVSGGGFATAWTDMSGTGNDLASSGGNPIFETAYINGFDAVRSTGAPCLSRAITSFSWPDATVAYVSRVATGGGATGTVVLGKTGQADFNSTGAALFGSNASPTQCEFHQGLSLVTSETLPLATVRITTIAGTSHRLRTSEGVDISNVITTAGLSPTHLGLFARMTGAIPVGTASQNIALSEVVIAKVGASAAQYAALDAYFRSRYPTLY